MSATRVKPKAGFLQVQPTNPITSFFASCARWGSWSFDAHKKHSQLSTEKIFRFEFAEDQMGLWVVVVPGSSVVSAR